LSRIYRVLRKAFAQAPFDGEGAYCYGGRWSSPGIRVSYASEYQSLAMLEYFVHLDADDPPPDLVLATAEVPDEIRRESIDESKLPSNWRETPARSIEALGRRLHTAGRLRPVDGAVRACPWGAQCAAESGTF
jgi:RES domain-containing protein